MFRHHEHEALIAQNESAEASFSAASRSFFVARSSTSASDIETIPSSSGSASAMTARTASSNCVGSCSGSSIHGLSSSFAALFTSSRMSVLSGADVRGGVGVPAPLPIHTIAQACLDAASPPDIRSVETGAGLHSSRGPVPSYPAGLPL